MPCFLLLIVLLFPRVALVLMWIYSTYLQRAFHGGLILPVLGFIFLPLTTIVYAWELNSGLPTSGINLLWLLIAPPPSPPRSMSTAISSHNRLIPDVGRPHRQSRG